MQTSHAMTSAWCNTGLPLHNLESIVGLEWIITFIRNCAADADADADANDPPCSVAVGGKGKGGGDAKTAKTIVRVLQRDASGGGRTLVMCQPVTGRTHQIRLHLQVKGYVGL